LVGRLVQQQKVRGHIQSALRPDSDRIRQPPEKSPTLASQLFAILNPKPASKSRRPGLAALEAVVALQFGIGALAQFLLPGC